MNARDFEPSVYAATERIVHFDIDAEDVCLASANAFLPSDCACYEQMKAAFC